MTDTDPETPLCPEKGPEDEQCWQEPGHEGIHDWEPAPPCPHPGKELDEDGNPTTYCPDCGFIPLDPDIRDTIADGIEEAADKVADFIRGEDDDE